MLLPSRTSAREHLAQVPLVLVNPHSRRSRRASTTSTPRTAELSDPQSLAAPDPDRGPWPGAEVDVLGSRVFVRHTPSDNPDAEPALYVHGLGGASTNFTDLADLLSPWLDGHALDLPGFGHSGPAPDDDYSIAAHTRLVISYLERTGRGPVHLVGNSMGGAISIQVAATRPDLIRTLTLISPAVPDLRPPQGTGRFLPLMLIPGLGGWLLAKGNQGSPESRARGVIQLCFAHPELVPPNRLAEAVDDIVARQDYAWAGEAFIGSLKGLVRTYLTSGTRSPWDALRHIEAPSLVVWGDRDRLVNVRHAPRVATALADATLLVLPDVGHTAQLEDPVSTARAILTLLTRSVDVDSQTGVGV